jgi:hypothetical protein
MRVPRKVTNLTAEGESRHLDSEGLCPLEGKAVIGEESKVSMSLQIAVEKTKVMLAGTDGTRREASLFLHQVGVHESRREKVGEVLNDSAYSFLPCENGEETELWNVEEISHVELLEEMGDLEELDAVGAQRVHARLHLVGGEKLEGDLVYEAEGGRERLLDLFNAPRPRFVLMITPDKTIYINRRAIVRAQP